MIIKYIITPIIATVIGYGTNYVAVKMLFRPRNELKLFGHTLPFTPGAIPKGKPRLAKAIGNVVGNTLITKEDIKEKLLSDAYRTRITEKSAEIFGAQLRSEIMKLSKADEEKYNSMKEKTSATITSKIMLSVGELEVGEMIASESGKIIKEKISGTMFKMFVNDELIKSVTKIIGDEVEKYIGENGARLVREQTEKKLDEIEKKTLYEVLDGVGIDKEKIDSAVSNSYEQAIDKILDKLFEKLDISKMIEDKINSMDMDEMEALVMKVMKKELDTIINLGAVIGFVLGIVNMLINMLLG